MTAVKILLFIVSLKDWTLMFNENENVTKNTKLKNKTEGKSFHSPEWANYDASGKYCRKRKE